MPRVLPVMRLSEACNELPPGLALMPYEEERGCSMQAAVQASHDSEEGAVSLFVGPEGGWDPGEVELARRKGVVTVSLGRRILRAETAAIASITVAMYSRGELGT